MVSGTKLGVTTYTTPTDTELLITRVFDAPPKVLFDAWTNPKHVPHWLLGPEGWTMPVCEIDLRPGGSWRYVWRKGNGTEMEMSGKYREVAPPVRVVWTESWGAEWPETVNALVLSEAGGANHDGAHDYLRVERGPRCGARDRDEGRGRGELRPARSDAARVGLTRLSR